MVFSGPDVTWAFLVLLAHYGGQERDVNLYFFMYTVLD